VATESGSKAQANAALRGLPVAVGPKNPILGTHTLYGKLEQAVAPLFYANRPVFIEVMRHAIAFNGSSSNTQRIVGQYAARAYLGEGRTRVVLQRR
jgi:hypothetical protein